MTDFRIKDIDPGYRVEVYRYFSLFGFKIGMWLRDDTYSYIKNAKRRIKHLKRKQRTKDSIVHKE